MKIWKKGKTIGTNQITTGKLALLFPLKGDIFPGIRVFFLMYSDDMWNFLEDESIYASTSSQRPNSLLMKLPAEAPR